MSQQSIAQTFTRHYHIEPELTSQCILSNIRRPFPELSLHTVQNIPPFPSVLSGNLRFLLLSEDLQMLSGRIKTLWTNNSLLRQNVVGDSTLQPYCMSSRVDSMLQPCCMSSRVDSMLQPYCTSSRVDSMLQPYCMSSRVDSMLQLYCMSSRVDSMLQSYCMWFNNGPARKELGDT
jgi:hypothetical protein